MNTKIRSILWDVFKISDLVLGLGCFLVSLGLVEYSEGTSSLRTLLTKNVSVEDMLTVFVFLLSWHYTFVAYGLYHNKRLTSVKSELIDALKASATCSAIVYVIMLLQQKPFATPQIGISFFITFSMALLGSRTIVRGIQRILHKHNRNIRWVLIIGTNERACDFAQRIEGNKLLGYCLKGFADDEWKRAEGFRAGGRRTVCSLDEVFGYLREHVVDEVFVALPLRSYYSWLEKLLLQCELQGISVRYEPAFFSSVKFSTESHLIGNIATVFHQTKTIDGWASIAKRLLDLTVATILLLLLSPILLITAAAIKTSSHGPILFSQKRIGLNRRIFKMYKFRTMIPGAEGMLKSLEACNDVTGPVFKMKEDPRVTKIGRILRRTSIDELPQLINVLRGEMSLIGPRPLPLRDYNGFENDAFRRRLSVKPGISCIWQISGRSNVSFERWMEMDLTYIDKWSLALDLRILFQTALTVVRGTGAV